MLLGTLKLKRVVRRGKWDRIDFVQYENAHNHLCSDGVKKLLRYFFDVPVEEPEAIEIEVHDRPGVDRLRVLLDEDGEVMCDDPAMPSHFYIYVMCYFDDFTFGMRLVEKLRRKYHLRNNEELFAKKLHLWLKVFYYDGT